jgi:hypothetical protein
LEAKDGIKRNAAAYFKKTAKYYLAKKHYIEHFENGLVTEEDKMQLKAKLLEKFKIKKLFKEAIQ